MLVLPVFAGIETIAMFAAHENLPRQHELGRRPWPASREPLALCGLLL